LLSDHLIGTILARFSLYLTDKYGPLEHEAGRKGDHVKLNQIAKLRAQHAPVTINRAEPRQGALAL
jgi:hypothetical protein